ncbi:hypothetical protein ACEQPO_21640 [Bacillus sp. SL00103]
MPRGFVVVIVLLLFLVVAAVSSLLVAILFQKCLFGKGSAWSTYDQMIGIVERFFTNKILPLYHDVTAQFNTSQSGKRKSILGQIQALGDEVAAKIGTFLQKHSSLSRLFWVFCLIKTTLFCFLHWRLFLLRKIGLH